MCNCHDCKDDIVTSDLAKFGLRELKMAAELLTAYTKDKPLFLWDDVRVMMNRNSGNVFLSDDDYNVGMMNGDKLEQWHNCPNCGHEGFAEDVFAKAPEGEDNEDEEVKQKCCECDYEF